MATFDNHADQAKRNLAFLVGINASHTSNWDWQVTVCYYVAVHLVNAHLARQANLHYRTHDDVKNAINPYRPNVYPVPTDVYLAYLKLEGLSRRSRYLCHDNPAQGSATAEIGHMTYDKHFAKAIKQLDKILKHFNETYSIDFGSPSVYCLELSEKTPLAIFQVRATI